MDVLSNDVARRFFVTKLGDLLTSDYLKQVTRNGQTGDRLKMTESLKLELQNFK